jgi:plasmid replication initiation protein
MDTTPQPTDQFNRIVTISNHAAEYPPLDLSKMQYQALLVSCIDSTQKPVYGIDDIVEEIRQRGITDTHEQMLFLEDIIMRQNTYRIPYKEYLRYFTGGDAPQGSVIQRAMDAVLSLNNKSFKFNNPDFEGSFVWFQAVALDKKNERFGVCYHQFCEAFFAWIAARFSSNVGRKYHRI